MAFDLKTALGSIAPTLATMLLGPLAGGAVSALTAAFGLTPSGSQSGDLTAITSVVQNGQMTPEIIAAVRIADQKHAEIISQQQIDLAKLNADHEQAMATLDMQQGALITSDIKDARDHNANSKEMWYLAYAILFVFAVIMFSVLVGCYYLLMTTTAINQTVAVAIAGLVGSVVGYVAANAQTVINFIYGGSLGSRNNAKALADSTKQSIEQLSANNQATQANS